MALASLQDNFGGMNLRPSEGRQRSSQGRVSMYSARASLAPASAKDPRPIKDKRCISSLMIDGNFKSARN